VNLNLVLGEEAEALKIERGEAGQEENALMEDECADRGELNFSEIGSEILQKERKRQSVSLLMRMMAVVM